MKINIKTLKGTDFFSLELDETATKSENQEATSQPQNQAQSSSTETTSVTNPTDVPKAQTQHPQSQISSSQSSEGSDLLQGPELEAKIKEIESMGFERPKIIQALKAAYYNAERAVDYLLSGKIPQLREGPAQGTIEQQGLSDTGGQQGAGLEQLAQMVQNPQFQQIAQAIRQNPALLQPIMQQLAQTNPQVAAILQQNPQMFIQLLLQASGGSENGQNLPSNAIQVTPEEKADIDDIISLGFEKSDALEAYITCDKNKEIAINYLFDARESGTLLSEHIKNEKSEAQQNPPNSNQSNNQQQGGQKENDDEDDFMY